MSSSLNAREKILNLISRLQLDGILLRKRANFSWFTQGKQNQIVLDTEKGIADLIILPHTIYCITSRSEADRLKNEELKDLQVEWVIAEWYENQDEIVKGLLKNKTIGTDLPFYSNFYMEEEIKKLRYTLSELEIDRYRWLSKKTALAVETTLKEIEPGWTEHEIAALVTWKLVKEGIQPNVMLVATDERIYQYRHPIPTDKKLSNYAMIVVCAMKWGLVSNCTRLVYFGELPKDLKAKRDKLATVDVVFNVNTRPGTSIKEVFNQGGEKYRQLGYPDEWKYLHQGGLTGYAPRELIATSNSNEKIEVNQVFTWNPSIQGVASEDTILIKENDNEFLTHTGKWKYIDVDYQGKTYKRPDILLR